MTTEELNKKLKSIGKAMFRDVLYNEIMANPNVTAEEILSSHPELNGLSLGAFRTRVSNAKTIFQNGAEQEALDIIGNSRAK